MKLSFIILAIVGLSLNSKISVSQDLTAWSADTLELANTAKDAAYLTTEEKKVIQTSSHTLCH
jgi:hypothetical protein